MHTALLVARCDVRARVRRGSRHESRRHELNRLALVADKTRVARRRRDLLQLLHVLLRLGEVLVHVVLRVHDQVLVAVERTLLMRRHFFASCRHFNWLVDRVLPHGVLCAILHRVSGRDVTGNVADKQFLF